ncbi:MAG: hypothetical protein Q4P25_03770 [Tissierellia bacterium]|nr:hypothetical protein [Tissierellia bacterium]
MDECLKNKLDNIVFIELKRDISRGSVTLPKNLPLPILKNDLVEGITSQSFLEQVDLESILKGMTYLWGIETEFPKGEKYKEILNDFLAKKEEYFLFQAYQVEEDQPTDAYIYLQSYENLYGLNMNIFYSKTLLLERYYNQEYERMDPTKQSNLLERIIKNYGLLIDKYPEFSLSYLRLGYINLSLQRFIKSKLYFEQFLNQSDDEELKNEVRLQLEEVENYANIESAQTYISYGKFKEAIQYLEKITLVFPDQCLLYYLKGLCNYQLGSIEEAKYWTKKSLQDDITEKNINLLAMILINDQKVEEANLVYKKGTEKYPNSYLLQYNSGLVQIEMNNLLLGIKSLKKANDINPNNELKSLIKKYEKQIKWT